MSRSDPDLTEKENLSVTIAGGYNLDNNVNLLTHKSIEELDDG